MVRLLAGIRVFFAAVCLLALALPAQAGTPVRVGVYNYAPLLFYENGQAQGLFVDVLKDVAAREQWDLEFVFGSWAECLERLENREIDILPCSGWSEERAARFDFTRVYLFLDWGVIYRRKGAPIRNLFDLAGKRVSALDGSVYTSALASLGEQFDILFTIERTIDHSTALALLSGGDADAAVCTYLYGTLLEDKYKVERTNIIFSPVKLHYAAPKGDYARHLQALDAAMGWMKQDKDSVYFQSYDRWMGFTKKPQLPGWVLWSGLGLVGGLAALGLVAFTLRGLVRRRTAELKDAMTSLAQSEERSRFTFEQAAVGMAYVGLDGSWLRVNQKLCGILGYGAEELTGGMTFQDVTHPDDVAQDLDSYSRLQRGEFAVYSMEKRYIRKDGSMVWVDLTSSLIRDERGTALHSFAVVQDISERKRVEKELEQARYYIRNIINSMPSVVIGVDAQGQITLLNMEASKRLPNPDAPLVGVTLESVFPEYAARMEDIRRAIRERKPLLFEKRPTFEEDEVRYQDMLIYPLVANGVEGAVLRIDDVTERVRLAEMMVQNEKMMSVGGLAAGMAHEINNPLGAILQSAQVVQRYLDPGREANRNAASEAGCDMDVVHAFLEKRKVPQFLESIREAGLRAARIVANMLEFSRRGETRKEFADLADILDKSLELAANDYDLKKKYDFRHLDIVREYSPDVPPVRCSRTEIEQVMLNLLKNAAQAMFGKTYGPGVRPTLTLRTAVAGESVVITLEDNGPGMEESVRKRVFEPFFTTKGPKEGTGLGLSVSYFIITTSHEGVISVESAPGKGSRFTIELPAATR